MCFITASGTESARGPRCQVSGFRKVHLDRLGLLCKGDTIRASVNGKEAFSGGVKDGDLPNGMPGPHSVHKCCFDNVEMRAAR